MVVVLAPAAKPPLLTMDDQGLMTHWWIRFTHDMSCCTTGFMQIGIVQSKHVENL